MILAKEYLKSGYIYVEIYNREDSMKIVIDEKIPYIKETLVKMGHSVTELPGNTISRENLREAEALFVRTRTKCNASLLDGTAVRFIGTATIGYDHIDKEYCKEHGIVWANAPGCNANAVLQYVESSIFCWMKSKGYCAKDITLGIVGVGEIGSRIARWAGNIGIKCLLNDPPRASKGETGFCSLDEIAATCNVITFHTTLNRSGDFPSWHLADSRFMQKLRNCKLLINASRGEVVDNKALLDAIEKGIIEDVAIDVWEHEPNINLKLLEKAYIATPHIAGYSAEGKLNASRMVLEAFADFCKNTSLLPITALPTPQHPLIVAESILDGHLKIYSPLDDTTLLKSSPDSFEDLRNNYILRREPSAYQFIINNHKVP